MTGEIVKTIFIKASPETVWAYLVDKHKLGEWFHEAKMDLVSNGDYILLSTDRPGETLLYGKILEFDPPKRLAHTFTHQWLKNVETVVTWDLIPAFEGTRLTLTHSGFEKSHDPFGFLIDHDEGWDEHLTKLRHLPGAA